MAASRLLLALVASLRLAPTPLALRSRIARPETTIGGAGAAATTWVPAIAAGDTGETAGRRHAELHTQRCGHQSERNRNARS